MLESAALLRRSGVDCEFRTTVVREFHTAEDIRAIGEWLRGAKRYFLQQFVDSGDLVGSGCHGVEPLELRAFARIAEPYFETVETRGLD